MTEQPPIIEAWFTFAGHINNESCARLFTTMAHAVQMNLKHLHLLIQSPGGNISDGIAMYNLLRGLPMEVITYNIGATESIAVLPYLAGKTRRVSKHATFLIHRTTCTLAAATSPTAADLRAHATVVEIYDSNVEDILRTTLKMPDDKWAAHGVRDLVITAKEAVAFSLAHEIGEFEPLPGSLVNI